MRFEGRVYFDFASRDTWHLYRFLAAAAGRGAELASSWVPFLADEDPVRLRALAAFVAVKTADPGRHGAYLQAVLTSHHAEGAPLDDATSLAAAAAAGVDPGLIATAADHEEAVRLVTDEARGLGVTTTPTIYRHGPVLHVQLNPAALDGDVLARLGLIDAVLGDDGVWALVKP